MVIGLNQTGKFFRLLVWVVAIAFNPLTAQAQSGKKKAKPISEENPGYAYQTYSTLGKKQKVHSHGSSDPRFHVEKPVKPTPYRNGRGVNTRNDSFGQKKTTNRKPQKNRGKRK
jgi:hypothetical protein